ncbi:MAG: hypothetical protein AB8E15_02455 [Bdellovibrionales bacterium]
MILFKKKFQYVLKTFFLLLLNCLFSFNLSASNGFGKLFCSNSYDLRALGFKAHQIPNLLQQGSLKSKLVHLDRESQKIDFNDSFLEHLAGMYPAGNKGIKILVESNTKTALVRVLSPSQIRATELLATDRANLRHELTMMLSIFSFFTNQQKATDTTKSIFNLDKLNQELKEGYSQFKGIAVNKSSLHMFLGHIHLYANRILSGNKELDLTKLEYTRSPELLIRYIETYKLLEALFYKNPKLDSIYLTISRRLALDSKDPGLFRDIKNQTLVRHPKEFEYFALNAYDNVFHPTKSVGKKAGIIESLSNKPEFESLTKSFLDIYQIKERYLKDSLVQMLRQPLSKIGFNIDRNLLNYVKQFQHQHNIKTTTEALLYILQQTDTSQSHFSYRFGQYEMRKLKIAFAKYLSKNNFDSSMKFELESLGIVEKVF